MSKCGLNSLVLILALHGISLSQAKTVAQTSYRWDPHRPAYNFVLEVPGDPDVYTQLRIVLPNARQFTFPDSGGTVKIADQLKEKRLVSKNLIRSEYFYFSPELRNKWGVPALVLFGYAYASDPGVIQIFELDSSGIPHKVFDTEFLLTDIKDLDGDGKYELVGKHSLSQLWGKCFSTYDPFLVYRLPSTGRGKSVPSMELSKSYNLKHYYGWAGPNSSEDLAIVMCAKGGKPVIMKAKDAERIYGQ